MQLLSAKVLHRSNSAYFGCSKNVSTIQEAVSLIGLEKLRMLVIASGVTSAFTAVPSLDLARFWQRSLGTASVAAGNTIRYGSDNAHIAFALESTQQSQHIAEMLSMDIADK